MSLGPGLVAERQQMYSVLLTRGGWFELTNRFHAIFFIT